MMQIVSLKIEENFLKLAIFEKKFKLLKVKHLEIIDLEETQREEVLEKIKVFENFSSRTAIWILGIENSSLIHKNLNFPPLPWRKVKKLIPFQKESLFPYDVEKLEIKEVFFHRKEGKTVNFFAYPKAELDSKVVKCTNLGIQPDAAIFDYLGIQEFLKTDLKNENGLLINLSEKETSFFYFNGPKIYESFSIPDGYNAFKKDSLVGGLEETSFFLQIKTILKMKKTQDSPKILLSGFFVNIPGILEIFDKAEFALGSKKENLFLSEIANAKFFIKNKKNLIDLSYLELPKAREIKLKGLKLLKKIIVGLISLCLISTLTLNFLIRGKISDHLNLKTLFQSQSLYSIQKILTEMVEQDKKLPIILDLRKQPLSIFNTLEAISKPITENNCELIFYSYQLEKFPRFKQPGVQFLLKIHLDIKANEKDFDNFLKSLKKLPFVEVKKGIKTEKKNDEYKLEFFFKSF